MRNIHFSASSSKAASNCSEIISYMGDLDGEQKQLIKKLVNFRMIDGKRTRVRAIVYKTFHRPARTERDVIKLMVDAVENIKPICEVVKVGVAGTIYDVPGIVARSLLRWESWSAGGGSRGGGRLPLLAGRHLERIRKRSVQIGWVSSKQRKEFPGLDGSD